MNGVPSLADQLATRVEQAVAETLPSDAHGHDLQIHRSEHADYQANGVFSLASRLRRAPRDIAASIAEACAPDDVIASCQVSGTGFLNLVVADEAIMAQVAKRSADPRLGVPIVDTRRTVIDYSQPNIAKEMHVGHLRGTIIGDALVRVLTFLGAQVIRQNHLGDWGTQFGMLIQYLDEHPDMAWRHVAQESSARAVSTLNTLYQNARAAFDADRDFAQRARRRVVRLQSGDPETLAQWREIVDESKRYFDEVYGRLDVLLTDDDAVGESFYNPSLQTVAYELEQRRVAVESQGALCVFFDDIKGPLGDPVPFIVRKADGGFGYAATDLAAIRYRVDGLHSERILYVVDARQALHFKMVFETSRRAGWLPDGVDATHVMFGSVLGSDGRPFKTRAGDAFRLIELLDEAVVRARATVTEKSPNLPVSDLDAIARQVGIGAVKYADLVTGRTKDYVFDLGRMVSLSGNTGVYLQYAHARVRSILRRLDDEDGRHPATVGMLEPAERRLALHLDEFSRAVIDVGSTLEPHRLCAYLFLLAQVFTEFYESCPVLKAASPGERARRILLCKLTAETLRCGLGLLGIATPDRL
jgi:arginyl-tRNA synthetase